MKAARGQNKPAILSLGDLVRNVDAPTTKGCALVAQLDRASASGAEIACSPRPADCRGSSFLHALIDQPGEDLRAQELRARCGMSVPGNEQRGIDRARIIRQRDVHGLDAILLEI